MSIKEKLFKKYKIKWKSEINRVLKELGNSNEYIEEYWKRLEKSLFEK